MEKILAIALVAFVLAGTAFASPSCISYDQGCSSNPSGCCGGLSCDNGPGGSNRCTQQPGVCTNMPSPVLSFASLVGNATNNTGPAGELAKLENGTGLAGSGSGIYRAGWFSRWDMTALLAVAIVISLISIVAMAGYGFNIPEFKAFVHTELMQAIVSVLLVASLIAIVVFLDQIARETINSADLPVRCDQTGVEPCYISAAKQYLSQLYDTANQYAKNGLKESFDSQRLASTGWNTQANTMYLAFAGASGRNNAGWSIQAERGGALFEMASKMLSTIYAQRYFIDVISFGIAPIFLLLGIILRAFFFTRKLGGLMLAIAISLFIVYPLTYVFAWYTLNVTVYGERTLAATDPACPAECTARYPVAFYIDNGKIVSFETTQQIIRAGIDGTNWESGDVDGDNVANYPGLVACRDLSSAGIVNSLSEMTGEGGTGSVQNYVLSDPGKSWGDDQWAGYTLGVKNTTMPDGYYKYYEIEGNTQNTITVGSNLTRVFYVPSISVEYRIYSAKGGCDGCPDYCREVPFPSTLPGCNITKCASCNAGCKIMRQRSDCLRDDVCGKKCDVDFCRTKQPVENKCYSEYNALGIAVNVTPANLSVSCSGCEGCPSWCKILYEKPDGTRELLNKDAVCTNNPACMPPYMSTGESTPRSGTCQEKCLHITKINQSAVCDDMCGVCPRYCRVEGLNTSGMQDLDFPPSVIDACLGNATVAAACKNCPNACKIEVPPANLSTCAPYPSKANSSIECKSCPDYCRYNEYSFIDSGISNTPMDYSAVGELVPYACSKKAYGGISCESTGNPQHCGAECHLPASSYPLLCRDYNDIDIADAHCRKCPEGARLSLAHIRKDGSTEKTLPMLGSEYSCGNDNCAIGCKPEFDVPGENTPVPSACSAAFGQTCDSTVWSGAECCNAGLSCQMQGGGYACAACTLPRLSEGEACSAGNAGCCQAGTSCVGGVCRVLCKDYSASAPPGSGSCEACPAKCRLGAPSSTYLDPACSVPECLAPLCNNSCKAAPAPSFKGTVCSEYVGNGSADAYLYYGPIRTKIDDRPDPYNDRSNCRQCPENCRILGQESDCGVPDNTGNTYVDCSFSNCPNECRVAIPTVGNPIIIQTAGKQESVLLSEGSTNPEKMNAASNGIWLSAPIASQLSGSKGSSLQPGGVISLSEISVTCANEGESCDSEGCCAGLGCFLESDGHKRCSSPSSCVPSGGDCYSRTGDCCSSLQCNDLGYAKKCGLPCQGAGSPCNSTSLCCTPQLKCEVSPPPALYNKTCVQDCASSGQDCSSKQCCGGLSCNTGASPPTCNVCKGAGQNAASASECCVGLSYNGLTGKCDVIGNTCGASELFKLPCSGCTALCRRDLDVPAPSTLCDSTYCGSYNSVNKLGCTQDCKLPDAPLIACSECMECESDCLYYPAVRTNCAEVCTDEALAGPVNIGPADFYKKLPGAQGAVDVKNIGALMVPALVLPLFSIVIVISFIRVLSPVLGGDIEIPGIGRII